MPQGDLRPIRSITLKGEYKGMRDRAVKRFKATGKVRLQDKRNMEILNTRVKRQLKAQRAARNPLRVAAGVEI